jgi:hypothetical protein
MGVVGGSESAKIAPLFLQRSGATLPPMLRG